jgi:tagatose-6-phosphate ketose/aldose isomerase
VIKHKILNNKKETKVLDKETKISYVEYIKNNSPTGFEMSDLIFGFSETELRQKGASHTANEIYGQPELWLKTWDSVNSISTKLQSFLQNVLHLNDLQIILTGAGTSAFIGDVLQGPIQAHTKVPCRAIPTTDLVTHPELFIIEEKPTLLISFARSGNSPESVKAVELVNQISNNIIHLIVTCNPMGKLAKLSCKNECFVFVLPPESDDQSLAMTGSFSSMLLTGLLIFRLDELSTLKNQITLMSEYGREFFENYLTDIQKIAELDFNRAVFLGSGLFAGIARESHLKLQELTDGKVVCKHDTFLGFRHGPKAVIDEKTLITYLFSNNSYSQKYEVDLVKSVNSGRNGMHQVGIMEKEIDNLTLDTKIILSKGIESLDEEFLPVLLIIFAQLLGFFKSLNLGFKPDSPSEEGIITRVVENVNLYNYEKNSSRIRL